MGRALRFTVLSLALACGAASAQLAYTAKAVNLRAGPARDFPVVAVLPAGLQVSVQGCLSDYTWCDVIASPYRGWVYGGNISYAWQNTYAPVLTWGAVAGIAIIGFVLDDYWSRHYWRSPWYAERHRWADRAWPAPPPRVRPHPGPRPPEGRPLPPPQGRPPPPQPGVRPQPPRPPRPPGAARPHPRPPGVAPAQRPPGPAVQPRPYVAPGNRPPAGAQPRQPAERPHAPPGERPRHPQDGSGRGQRQ